MIKADEARKITDDSNVTVEKDLVDNLQLIEACLDRLVRDVSGYGGNEINTYEVLSTVSNKYQNAYSWREEQFVDHVKRIATENGYKLRELDEKNYGKNRWGISW